MKRRRPRDLGYGNAPIHGGVPAPAQPPHPLDRACCRRWWRAHRAVLVRLKIADVFGFGGNPRLLLLFARDMPSSLLRLGTIEPIPPQIMVWRNSRYQVNISRLVDVAPFGAVLWLSIKRVDRRPIRSWRELQRIKNELVGPDVEAVEIFPAEARLVDTSNQYHLFCFPSGYRLPFGYAERLVMEATGGGAVQEPWEAGTRPPDVLAPEAAAFLGKHGDQLVQPIVTPRHDTGEGE